MYIISGFLIICDCYNDTYTNIKIGSFVYPGDIV